MPVEIKHFHRNYRCRCRCRTRLGGHSSQFLASYIAWVVAIIMVAGVALGPNQKAVLALSSKQQQPQERSKLLYPNRRVVLVTGANKGIGYEIAKKLISHGLESSDNEKDGDGDAFVCILGCRNKELGAIATKNLVAETKRNKGAVAVADMVQIDLMDHGTISRAVSYIKQTYGRCDVLINNAAVCYNDPTLYGTVPHTAFAQQAKTTIATNFFGTLALTKELLPLLEQSTTTTMPRIINIASSAGRLSIIPSEEKRKFLSSKSLTVADLEACMNDFVQASQEGRHASEGWPNTGYGVSKVGIIAMTKILARQYSGSRKSNDNVDEEQQSDGLGSGDRQRQGRCRMMINSVDPGYCATDQNNHQGVIPAKRGAVTPYLLATLNQTYENNNNGNDERFTGKHWYQEREIEW